MHVVGLDFETFYSNTLPVGIDADGKTIRGYTLSKMSTEQYVRHELFELVMVTVVDYHTKAVHKIVTDRCDVMQAELLKLYPDWSQVIVIAHNSVFDGSILEWRVGLRAKAYICTMQMANVLVGMKSAVSLAKLSELFGLPPKGDDVVRMDGKRLRDISKPELDAYVAYCERDTLNALMLFDRYMAMGFPVDDLQIVDSTIKMFVRPQFIVDVPLAQRSLVEEKARRAKLLTDIGESAEAIRSNDQFADLLRAEGVEPPMKPSPSDPEKLIYAFAKTDEELIELQEHENPRVAALVDVRLGVKSSIIETRLEKFLDIASRGALPVAITYGGAKVTHRFSANRSEASNMQNLPRGSVLREVVAAPPGHVMVATDLSAIELRVARWLAWRWYQDAAAKETLDLVRSGGDVYCATASRAYGRTITKADKTERQAGKETELSCQFRVGHEKLNHRLRMTWGVYLEPGMDKVLVNTFREVNKYGVVQGWKDLDLLLAHMADGNIDAVRAVRERFYPFVITDDFRFVSPCGLAVYYPELRWDVDAKGRKSIVYTEQKGRASTKKWLHGGSLMNNCLRGDTFVLTRRGWVQINHIKASDQVHDGDNWVSHGGMVYKSHRKCTVVDGVYMTDDHKVLTDGGWKAASEKPRPYRPKVRAFDRLGTRAQRWAKTVLGVPMSVWGCTDPSGYRCEEIGSSWISSIVWVCFWGWHGHPQNDETPRVYRVQGNAAAVLQPQRCSVQKLRGAWYYCVRALAEGVREVLGRYGSNVEARTHARPYEQRQGVFPVELQVGDDARADAQQADIDQRRRYCDAIQANRDCGVHVVLPLPPRAATYPVYDILNAGPQHRFVVLGEHGPFIVHNCVQHLAGVILKHGWNLMLKERVPPAIQVHDELISCPPEQYAAQVQEIQERCMTTVPAWAEGLPLAVETHIGKDYKACK